MEGDETVDYRPPLNGLLQDHLLGEDVRLDVLKLLQPRQDLLHWLAQRLLLHGTDADYNLEILE